MYHKVLIVGHLGRDPELRYTPTGSPVCNFNVAANRKRKDGEDVVTWFRVTTWGNLAENCNEYLAKGRQVLVEGQLQPDTDGHPKTFTRSDGTCGASYELTAHAVQFLGNRGDDGGADDGEQRELPF
jgi:single-strand DNA-binding protein